LAEDPAALRRTKPELFDKIAQVYPQVLSWKQWRVHLNCLRKKKRLKKRNIFLLVFL
jgi:hypothetical protein